MAPPLAALIVVVGIIGLFWLNRGDGRVSRAVVVPFIWLLIAMSRPVTSWTSGSMNSLDRAEVYLEGSPMDRAILMTLIAMAAIVLWRRRDSALAILRANGAVIALFLYCLISISWSDYSIVSAKRWVRGVADVMMILVILTDPRPAAAFQWIITRVGFILVPLSILFIRYYPDLGRAYSIGGRPMWTGVCTDKNALGALCMIVGAVTLWRIMDMWSTDQDDRRTARLIALTTIFAMVVYLISIVDSKTAQMCFLFAVTVVGLRGLFRRPWLVFGYTVATVAACYLVLIAGVGGGTLEAIGRNETLTGRTTVWGNVLLVAEDSQQIWGTRVSPWLGAGYESFWMGQRLILLARWGGNSAHNGYLETYVNLGWFGLAFLAAVIVAGYRNLIAFLRVNPDIGRLKVAFFVIFLTYNFSESAFRMMMPVWLMFLWATLATPLEQPARSVARARRFAIPPVALAGRVAATRSAGPRHVHGRHTQLPVRQ